MIKNTLRLTSALCALAALVTTPSFAGSTGDAGCGLGSLAWGSNNGKLAQVSAATTNGTSGSQTFGITTGTSNCTAKGLVRVDRQEETFANVNLDAISTEMAQGQGEHLSTLVRLMGCNEQAQPAVASMAQREYSRIFPASDTTGREMLDNLHRLVQQDRALSVQCSKLALN